jgi:predicted transcriptional regulator
VRKFILWQRIKLLKESQSTKADWWNELTLAEKEAIDQGLEDADKGNVMAHEDVRKRYSKWL